MQEDEFLFQRAVMDTMTWSFTRLTNTICPYAWKLCYLDKVPGENNFYGQYGTYCHKILEMFYKGELTIFDVVDYYKDHYIENITYDAPRNKHKDIAQDYYDRGLRYFSNLAPLSDEWTVLGVEKEIHFMLADKYPFIGFIDLLLRSKEDGTIKVVDHKSGSIKKTKKGEISKSEEKHFKNFRRQLYLYSIAVHDEYDTMPSELEWNLFKDADFITIPFSVDEYKETQQWAVDTIKKLENTMEWLPNPNKFFCDNLCDFRNIACEYHQERFSPFS